MPQCSHCLVFWGNDHRLYFENTLPRCTKLSISLLISAVLPAPRSTEWFDGVDFSGETAAGSSTATPREVTEADAPIAADSVQDNLGALLGFGFNMTPSGLSGLATQDADASGADLIILRGRAAAQGPRAEEKGPETPHPNPGNASPGEAPVDAPANGSPIPGHGSAAAGEAPAAGDRGCNGGRSNRDPEGRAGSDAGSCGSEADMGACVSMTVAAGAGERRIDAATTSVQMHVYLEARQHEPAL